MRTAGRIAFQNILHLIVCMNTGNWHMCTPKFHLCPVSELFLYRNYKQQNWICSQLNKSLNVVVIVDAVFCYCVSSISFLTVKQRSGSVLPPFETTCASWAYRVHTVRKIGLMMNHSYMHLYSGHVEIYVTQTFHKQKALKESILWLIIVM